MKNTDFAKNEEKRDYELMVDFNSILGLRELGRTPEKHTTDASGYTTDGRYLNIELKSRNMRLLNGGTKVLGTSTSKDGRTYHYTADTLYIEAHKAGDMYLDYQIKDEIPMYINFLEDDVVVVFNLTRLKKRPKTIIKKIWSELYQAFELAKRELLSLDDAWIYQKINNEYRLIKKPR